ncbi:unnamed protein product [Spirodela intermedia]|uniref:UBC core domain-containing protein n=1 Tax=Spirodela intermedia TaxID=51605 RepID=A0A7I8JSA0_SPIIN|nr:unnamed protein product [Spirodela intermedia]CAA6672994.1 unnamed protein product [Spirodela intermedia]
MGDNYLVGSSEYHASEAGKPLETLPSTAYANVWSQQNDDKANDDQNLLVFGQNTINSKLKQVIVEDRNWERYFVGSSSFRAPEADKPLETLPSTAYADAWSQQNDVNGIEVNADDAQNLLEFGQGAVNGKLKQVVVEGQNWERYFVGSSSFNPSEADKPLENLNSTEENGTFINGDLWDDDDYEDEDDNYDDYAYENDAFDSHFNYDQAEKFDHLDFPPGVEATFPWWQKLTSDKGSICNKSIEVDKIDAKFKEFKQFDSVQDYSDHHFFKLESEAAATCVAKEPPKCWMKRIQYEWKLLQKDLPETIFIRVYEARMDLLRALIIGPSGTPYHDGLFFFDCFFPSTYPDSPPVVRYHSGGLRLNPNLYASGKVCLSLLGTWSGEGCEKWNPKTSTMLQVLVSIQALVLNANPYFNEPGYELSKSTRNFEDFVAGHFRKHGRGILVACRAYMNGAKVGRRGSWPTQFKSLLKTLFEELLMEFTVKGADCSIFLAQKLRAGLEKSAGEVDTTLKL